MVRKLPQLLLWLTRIVLRAAPKRLRGLQWPINTAIQHRLLRHRLLCGLAKALLSFLLLVWIGPLKVSLSEERGACSMIWVLLAPAPESPPSLKVPLWQRSSTVQCARRRVSVATYEVALNSICDRT